MAGDFEHKDMSGAVFKNGFKEKPNQPDYTGNAKISGTVYRVAGWIKETRGGDKFLSLAFSLKEEKSDNGFSTPAPRLVPSADFEDDIPF
jgi:hypothetical protein